MQWGRAGSASCTSQLALEAARGSITSRGKRKAGCTSTHSVCKGGHNQLLQKMYQLQSAECKRLTELHTTYPMRQTCNSPVSLGS